MFLAGAKKGLSPGPGMSHYARPRQWMGIFMWNLTAQQRRVLCIVILLLLFGWAVKAWRLAHPPARQAVTSVP